jgi:hypothetical protein
MLGDALSLAVSLGGAPPFEFCPDLPPAFSWPNVTLGDGMPPA